MAIPPTPDGTFATQITTDQGTWSFGPGGETLLGQHMDNGIGKDYCLAGGIVYTQGKYDDQWYVWKGQNHWELYGPNPPIPRPEPPLPVTPTLPRLVRRGAFFQLETGDYFTAIECTDFQLFQRFLNGEDITPILSQRQELGFNMVRVLGTCAQMFRLYPQEHTSYYDLLRPLADLCAMFSLYMEFVVFADATMVMPDPHNQLAHWPLIGTGFKEATNLLIEAVNEEDQPVNRVAAIQSLTPLPGFLCAHGSNGSERPPVRAPFSGPPLQAGDHGWWGYETGHFNDAFQWQRKTGHNAMEYSDGARYTSGQYNGQVSIPASHVPILSNENTRTDKDGNVNHFQDAAMGAALLCAGSCFHFPSGKTSTLATPDEQRYAQAWVMGAQSVPLKYQDGNYYHRADLEPPGVLRAYERRLPSGDGHVIQIRD